MICELKKKMKGGVNERGEVANWPLKSQIEKEEAVSHTTLQKKKKKKVSFENKK